MDDKWDSLKDYIKELIEWNRDLVGYDDHSGTLEQVLEKMDVLEKEKN
jgi:hypothetical protein